ncbi:MAG: hypothetical protein WAL77_11640 [Candidatus Dormiibacterota bacterium]
MIVPESTALDVNADRLLEEAEPEPSLSSMTCELYPVKSSVPIARSLSMLVSKHDLSY